MRIAFPCLRPGILRLSSRIIPGAPAVPITRRACGTMASAGSQDKVPGADPGAATKKQPAAAKPAKKEVKILMLHGFTQSGPLFHAKTRALEKLLVKTLAPWNLVPVLHYPTAPNRLRAADIPGYSGGAGDADDDDPRAQDSWAWFRRDEAAGSYRQLAEGMRAVAAAIRGAGAGGVDGVVGFSQGGAVAAMVAAALEPGRPLPAGEDRSWAAELREANGGRPLRFAVVYSGFLAVPPELAWLSEPPVATPTLHFIGSLDTVVDESRSRALVARCVDPVVVEHPGAHYVPISKEWAMPLLGFVKKRCVDDEVAMEANL